MRKLKEFWLEPSPNLTAQAIRRIVNEAKPHAVVTEIALEKLGPRIASRRGGTEILLLSDPAQVSYARRTYTQVALEVTINNRKDIEQITQTLESAPDYLLIDCPDWKVIPLENLIAESKSHSRLMARTRSFDESRTALSTLELGADGIVLASGDASEVLKTRDLIRGDSPSIALSEAKVSSIRPIGTGARVCVDTTEILEPGEGLLTGSSSKALFLVEGEIHTNPHVNPRPFRVNAGPVSSYVLTNEGKTQYLSELSAGETVLLTDKNGRTRTVDVARVKIERRPMVLVEAQVGNQKLTTIVQNAETVRLVTKNGSKPVTEIQTGDEVLVRVESGGRHLGTKVANEMIIER